MRSFSGILPNLPIQISESLLANAKAQSLAEREVLYSRLATPPMVAIGLKQGLLKVSIASPQGQDERILTILGPGSIVGELAIIDWATQIGRRSRDPGLSVELHQPGSVRQLPTRTSRKSTARPRLHPSVTPARGQIMRWQQQAS